MRSSDGEEQLEIAFCFTFCAFCCAFSPFACGCSPSSSSSFCCCCWLFACSRSRVFSLFVIRFFSALFFVVVVLNFVYSRLFLQFVFCFSHSLQNLTEFALLSSLSPSSFAYQNFSLDSIFDTSLIIYTSSFAFFLSQHFLFICIASLTHQKKTNKNLTSASCDGAGRGGGGTDRVLSPDLCRSVDPSI